MKKAGLKVYQLCFWGAAGLLVGVAVLLIVPSQTVRSQQEVTSKIYRYRERVATGYYEGYEVSPRRARAVLKSRRGWRRPFPFGSSSAMVRIRARLPDSHSGLKFYFRNTCIECHPKQARNLHSTRAEITCRQCHGPEPIAAVNHYYSVMNPIRRHAYVCARCHEGATASFAEFYIHEPSSTALSTRKSFPVLFYAGWGMLLLLLGTMAFFVPHSFMVGLRELLDKWKGFEKIREGAFSILHRMMAGLGNFFSKKKAREDEADDVSETI